MLVSVDVFLELSAILVKFGNCFGWVGFILMDVESRLVVVEKSLIGSILSAAMISQL